MQLKNEMKPRPVITSLFPCPVCRNRKWHPLSDVPSNRPKDWYGRAALPAVDCSYGEFYDECTKCGTIVI